MPGNRFPLKMKGKVYHCCVRSAILYGSETWCLKENEKAILRRMERAVVRAMCSQKVIDRKTTKKQMGMLGLKKTTDQLATGNRVRWYGHVLRGDDNSVLRVDLNLEVICKRKRERPKKTWKKQAKEETEKIGLKKEDALRRHKWRVECEQLQKEWGKSGHLCLRDNTSEKLTNYYYCFSTLQVSVSFELGNMDSETERICLHKLPHN